MQRNFPSLLLSVAGKVIQFLKRTPEERVIRMSAIRTLGALQAKPGATPSELSHVLNVKPPSITELIGSYMQKGLVEKRVNPHDRRVVQLYLTNRGEAQFLTLFNEFAQEINKLCSLLTKEEQQELERIFKKLDAELTKRQGRI